MGWRPTLTHRVRRQSYSYSELSPLAWVNVGAWVNDNVRNELSVRALVCHCQADQDEKDWHKSSLGFGLKQDFRLTLSRGRLQSFADVLGKGRRFAKLKAWLMR